jgi:hypothetical protein
MPGKTTPRRRHRLLWTLGIVVMVLVILRAALPSIVKDEVNKRLAALEDYDGRIVDVDIALWRGAYRVDGIEIVKTGSRQPTPFFSADHVDFSIEWRSLLRGSLVGESVLSRPNVNLVRAENKEQSELGQGENWADALEALTPFRMNTVTIENGTVTFRAPGIGSKDALTATRLFGQNSNITNVVESGRETFALFQAQASVLDSGWANVTGSANPLAEQPTFDVNLTVKNVSLPEVNPWLREYIKADAEAGEFETYPLRVARILGPHPGNSREDSSWPPRRPPPRRRPPAARRPNRPPGGSPPRSARPSPRRPRSRPWRSGSRRRAATCSRSTGTRSVGAGSCWRSCPSPAWCRPPFSAISRTPT